MKKILMALIPALIFGGEYRGKIRLDESKLKVGYWGEYITLDYPGAYHTGIPGSPSLPYLSIQILIPSGSELEGATVLSVKSKKMKLDRKIIPNQKPVPIFFENKEEFVGPKDEFYTLKKYPQEILSAVHTGNMGGYTIASLVFSPVIYYPEQNEIEFIQELEYSVKYREGIPRTLSRKQKELFGRLVSNLVVNPEYLPIFAPQEKAIKDSNQVDLVIITNSTFAPYFDTLKKYKERRGYRTEVVTLDYIYTHYMGRDNPEKIRNFIIDYYTNKGLQYVILGGQADHENNQAIVPRRDCYYLTSYAGYYTDEDTIPTDLYYSDLDRTWNADNDNVWGEISDNVDMYPDVIVGRLPVRTVSQISNIINKIITYEETPPSGYLTNIALTAEQLWSQYNYWGDSIGNRIANITPTPPWNDIKLYQSLGTLNSTNVINTISSGVGFCHYAQHGTEEGVRYFKLSNIDSLTNGYKLGIHNAISCFTGAIDEVTGGDCFAESLVNHRSGGAVATIMNTRYGWGYPPQLGPSEIIDSTFYYYIFRDSIWTLGEAHALSLARWVPTAVQEGTNGVYRWCIYELWIFGDPTLQTWTLEPTSISAIYSSLIPVGSSTFEVDCDAPYAEVALSKQGILVGKGKADNSGHATVNIWGSILPGDSLEVYIRAKNRLPHKGYTIAQSNVPYVRYLSSYIEELSGNGNGRINPGEHLKLYVALKNFGDMEAENVRAILSTSNPHVSIINDSVYYGNITPSESTYGSGYFEFAVDSETVDMEVIPFTLNIVSSETTWVSSFNYNIYAPALSYLRVEVNDAGGNGNGVVDPGETVTLRVYARNTGHEDAQGVIGKITCTDSRVTINTNNLSMGDIPQSGSGYADFNVSFGSDINIGEVIPFGLRLTSGNMVFLDSFKIFVGLQYYTTSFEGRDYGLWTFEQPWSLRSDRAYDGNFSLGTGPYSPNTNASLYMPPFIAVGQCTLSFYDWVDLEANYDFGYIEYSLNGSAWTQAGDRRNGRIQAWQRVERVINANPGDTIRIRFRMTSDGSIQYNGWYIDSLKLGPVIAIPKVGYAGYEVEEVYGNGNGVQDLGEQVRFYLILSNGLAPITNVTGYLRALDANSTVLDSVSSYGDLDILSTARGDGFEVLISRSPSISTLSFRLKVVTTGYVDSFDVSIPVGLYVGPCAYGYRAFSDLSPYPAIRPTYNWIEIKNVGTQIASTGDDVTQTITLPFTFRFFGVDYTTLSVCSNGWIGFGSISSTAWNNTGIPNSSDPNNIIAVLWDDLNPNATGSGKIYYYYDPANHIFIVEYDSVYHYYTTTPSKAEVILYDPAFYPTPTGDGEIVIQYMINPGEADFTCGIENANGTDGIQYYYDGAYALNADPIVAGRAIKFTTDTTGVLSGLAEELPTQVKLLGISSNPLKGMGYVAFELPERMDVKVEIIDIQGRVVQVLANRPFDRGYHRISIDGSKLSQGIYFIRFKTKAKEEVAKFLNVR